MIVCPTCVGMNRDYQVLHHAVRSMPHVCGDEPKIGGDSVTGAQYAPRMWG